MNKMNKIPVVFNTDHNYVTQTGVCIFSLLRNSSAEEIYDIFILCSEDITSEDKSILMNTVKSSSPDSDINFITINDKFDNVYEARNISKATYYRLMIPDLITQYDKVIYSDVDVIFREGLSEAYNTNMEGYYFAGIKAIGAYTICDYIKGMGLNPDKYINAGFLIINSKLQREVKLYDKIKPHLSNKYQFLDQDIINIVAKDKIFFLPLKYCYTQKSYEMYCNNSDILYKVFSDDEVKEAEKKGIIHYEGTNKPWSDFCYRYDEWWYYYRNTAFYKTKNVYKTEYSILHPTFTLKDIIKLLYNYLKGEYKNADR